MFQTFSVGKTDPSCRPSVTQS